MSAGILAGKLPAVRPHLAASATVLWASATVLCSSTPMLCTSPPGYGSCAAVLQAWGRHSSHMVELLQMFVVGLGAIGGRHCEPPNRQTHKPVPMLP